MPNKNFIRALVNLLKKEGLYSNDPKDRGGETAYGVSRVHHPEMWMDGPPSLEDIAAFYFREFWTPLRCDSFTFGVADEIFDSGVNVGIRRVSRWLQKAYNLVRPESWVELVVDGKIGSRTIRAVNRICRKDTAWESALIVALNGYQFIHYERQNDHHHIRGWLSKRVGGYGT